MLFLFQQFINTILGLDEFEEKLDKLADGRGDSDWISQLYSKYAPVSQDGDWTVPEPPVLDTAWGLGRLGRRGNNYLFIQFLFEGLKLSFLCYRF